MNLVHHCEEHNCKCGKGSSEKFPGLFVVNSTTPKAGKKDPFVGLFLKPEVEEQLAEVRATKKKRQGGIFADCNFVNATALKNLVKEA